MDVICKASLALGNDYARLTTLSFFSDGICYRDLTSAAAGDFGTSSLNSICFC